MLNFSIKLTNTQMAQAGKCLGKMLNYSYDGLSYENYADYYNIKSILKKLFDKLYKVTGNKFSARISISANEIRSLRMLVKDNTDWLKNLTYELSIFQNISTQANAQEVNYITNFEHILN